MIHFVPVPAEHVATLWAAASPHLKRACDLSDGFLTPAMLLGECLTKQKHLLLIVDDAETPAKIPAAGVAHFVRQPDGRVACELLAAAGGELASWQHVVPEFEDWARHCGASLTRLCGRPGWVRAFRDYRRRDLVSLTKDL